ncbi:hypothetical protein [Sandaracinus amylolyticus]|uniref:hypothetical protein n=1 Tax=Sandaracinus amylolyticus TaxID=927083 RepID=UPI001F47D7D4|nr:hypothetical protein [Sandaracinus amylolyticus]
MALERKPSNITEASTLASIGVRETTLSLSGTSQAGAFGNAKVGLEITFTAKDQFYFHVPGLRFVGIEDMWRIGEKLVELARRDSHDPQFWEDDWCVVTGIYEVPSMLRVLSQEAGEKVALTAAGAGTVDALYEIGADFGFVSQNNSSVVLRETYRATTSNCVAFYEMHKVHWDIFGNKWWKSTTDLNP